MNPKQALTQLSHLSSRDMEAVYCLMDRIEELEKENKTLRERPLQKMNDSKAAEISRLKNEQ